MKRHSTEYLKTKKIQLLLTVRDHCFNTGNKAVSEMKINLEIGNSGVAEYLNS